MDADSLIKRIETAFADVTLGDGVTPAQADAIDSNADDEEERAARAQDQYTHWTQYSEEDIKRGLEKFPFFDQFGWRHFLPAAMRYVVRKSAFDSNESRRAALMVEPRFTVAGESRGVPGGCITESQRHLFDSLTPEQNATVAAFLAYLAVRIEDEALEALDGYWRQHLHDSAPKDS